MSEPREPYHKILILEKQLEIARWALVAVYNARTTKEPGMSVQSIPINKSGLQRIAMEALAKMEAVR